MGAWLPVGLCQKHGGGVAVTACQCGAPDADTCNCWETEAAKYNPRDIQGQIRLDELRDERYGPGRDQ